MTALLGGNGSGKSNVLRALNLFFNGVLEPGEPLQLRRDFHKPWRTVSDRGVVVNVEFTLPPEFTIHQRLREALANVGITQGASFSLAKRWERDPIREDQINEQYYIQLEGDQEQRFLEPAEARSAARFLQLIRFRYVPNHIRPAELLAAESGALQEALIIALKARRSRSGAGGTAEFDAVLREMADAGQSLMRPLAETLTASTTRIEALELETPTDWAEVAWSIGLKLRSKGSRSLDLAMHGSGHQTFLAYVLLAYLDTRFGQRFGWHQATIWALEEPESFLHADLENQLASYLVSLTSGPRFQALLTTHRLLFAAAADSALEVDSDAGETTVKALPILELAERMLETGTSSFVHPLNLTPPKPTLLVDGPSDVFYLTRAYEKSGRLNPWDIRSLESMDPGVSSGGKNNVKKYLKANQGPLRSRPAGSPVIVLLDWEDTQNDVKAFNALLKAHPTSRAVLWTKKFLNRDLGESFRGIERYLGTRLVDETAAAHPGIVKAQGGAGPFELMPQQKDSAKQALRAKCEGRNRRADVQPIVDTLEWLDSHLTA